MQILPEPVTMPHQRGQTKKLSDSFHVETDFSLSSGRKQPAFSSDPLHPSQISFMLTVDAFFSVNYILENPPAGYDFKASWSTARKKEFWRVLFRDQEVREYRIVRSNRFFASVFRDASDMAVISTAVWTRACEKASRRDLADSSRSKSREHSCYSRNFSIHLCTLLCLPSPRNWC